MTKFTFLILLLPLLLSAQDVTVRVIDEAENPIEGAEVTAYYDRSEHPIPSQTRKGETNEEGIFKCSGSAILGLSFWVKCEGYYDHGYVPAESDEIHKFPKKMEKVIQLRSVKNPTALYGSFYGGGVPPVESEWCGYDMQKGDWVKPHGQGDIADLLLRFEKEFMGFDTQHWQRTLEQRREFSKKAFAARGEEWTEEKFRLRSGKWDMHLEIAFPNEKDGLIKVEDAFNRHSVLRMPNEAPEEGYQASYSYTLNNYQPYTLRDDLGFFLRTRVVLDEDGNIESANFAKIHGDFKIHPSLGVGFTYYSNPVPNDRNLEFDPKQNLFPEGTPGTFNFVLP